MRGRAGRVRAVGLGGQLRWTASAATRGGRRSHRARGIAGGQRQSRPGRRRLRLISARRCSSRTRRRCEPRVGLVGLLGVGGATASRRSSARRCRAAARFRHCERCSSASTVSTVPASRGERARRTRSRCDSSRAVVAPRSMLSWTRESVVLTCWPPGPEDRENRSISSAAGTVSPRGAPGPGFTRRSSIPPVSRTDDRGGRQRPPGRTLVGACRPRYGRLLVGHR